jgi:hypothetical protein
MIHMHPLIHMHAGTAAVIGAVKSQDTIPKAMSKQACQNGRCCVPELLPALWSSHEIRFSAMTMDGPSGMADLYRCS